ncbi:MAG TPA: hypothetical protein VGG62_16375, partial [Terracidiphilus sp.]
MILSWFWKSVLAVSTVAALAAQSPSPRVVAITGGKLLTVSHGTIEDGTLVMADGKIAALGE